MRTRSGSTISSDLDIHQYVDAVYEYLINLGRLLKPSTRFFSLKKADKGILLPYVNKDVRDGVYNHEQKETPVLDSASAIKEVGKHLTQLLLPIENANANARARAIFDALEFLYLDLERQLKFDQEKDLEQKPQSTQSEEKDSKQQPQFFTVYITCVISVFVRIILRC